MTFKQVMHAQDDDDCSLNPINYHPDTAIINLDRQMHASSAQSRALSLYFIILHLYCNAFLILDMCARARASARGAPCAAVASL